MKGGPVLLVAPLPAASTVAVGAWMASGSAHEPDEAAEHLLLRRCGDRTPEAIAEAIDSLGGAVDAFTTREECAVTAHVPAERVDEALDLVIDAVFRPRPRAEDVELERGVIRAEFDLIQDSPGEVAAERALEACWGPHPLARPVMGRREVVDKLTAEALVRFHRQRFTAENLLLVAAGPVDERRLERRVSELPRRGVGDVVLTPPAWRPGMVIEPRDGLEQVYANLVLPALAADDPEILALGVLHQLLGGGASSRLFRELRDRLGLVYDVGSSVYTTAIAGVLEVSFSAPVRQAAACWEAVIRVLEGVAAGDVSDHEVRVAQRGLAASVTLGAEGPDALMEALAGEYLARGRRFDAETIRRELADVTPERVRALAGRVVCLEALAGAVCGPRDGIVLPSGIERRVA
jgi:predicted Zn-dependent peptidase